MTDEIKDNLGNPDNWLRAVLIVVFGLIFYVAVWVLGLVVLLNLVVLLVTGRRNDNLSEFGSQTGDYLMQIIRFSTLNSEVRPFPFGEWPDRGKEDGAPTEEPDKPSPAAEPAKKATPKTAKKTSKKTSKKKSRRKTAKKKTATGSKKTSSS